MMYKEAPLWLVTSVPLVAIVPLHAQLPLAVHEVALVLDQVMVESPPETIVDGLKVMVAVGAAVAAAAVHAPTTKSMESRSIHSAVRQGFGLFVIDVSSIEASLAFFLCLDALIAMFDISTQIKARRPFEPLLG